LCENKIKLILDCLFFLDKQLILVKGEILNSGQKILCRDGLEKSKRMKWAGHVARMGDKRRE
jgi:hypothetical protein